MSDNYVNVGVGTAPGTNVDTCTITGVPAGATITAWLWDGSNTSVSFAVSSSINGAFTQGVSSAVDTSNFVKVIPFVLENVTAGSHVLTGTLASGSNAAFIAGVAVSTTLGASAYSDDKSNWQIGPGTGAGVVTTTAMTIAAAATVVGMSADTSSTSVGNEPTAPTGYTSRAAGANGSIGAWRILTGGFGANAAALWTAVAGGDNYVSSGMAILNGTAPAVVTPNPGGIVLAGNAPIIVRGSIVVPGVA